MAAESALVAMQVPVVDASSFASGSASERATFAADLWAALQEHGFVRVRNHGVPSNMIKELFEWVRTLPSQHGTRMLMKSDSLISSSRCPWM